MKIYPFRFKWKKTPWMDPDNIVAVWFYCNDGDPEFEFELKKHAAPPDSLHVKSSSNKDRPNFVAIDDLNLINFLKDHLSSFNVCGAMGHGIIIGELELPIMGKKVKKVIMSSIKDWKKWQEIKSLSL